MDLPPEKTDFNLSYDQDEKIKQLNMEKLVPFLDDFSKVVGAPIDLQLYPCGTTIFSTGYRSIFEDLIKLTPDTDLVCGTEYVKCEGEHRPGETITVTCKHGLVYLLAPMKIFKETVARIYVGPMTFSELSQEDLHNIAIKNRFDEKSFIRAWKNIRVIDKDLLARVTLLLSSYKSTLESMIEDSIITGQTNDALRRTLANQARLEQEKQLLLDELTLIFDNSQVGIAYLQGGRFLARGNQRLADMFRWESPEAMAGMDLREVHLSEDNYQDFGKRYFNTLSHGERFHIEYKLKRKDGSSIWCNLSGKAVDPSRPADLTKGVIWIIDDISERKKLEEDLLYMATTDYLTSLPNRACFMKRSETAMCDTEVEKKSVALLMIDIDKFKWINDNYGHDTGDLVLKSFGDVIRTTLRKTDIYGRLGGDEFAALMPSTSAEEAISLAERLRREVASQDASFNGKTILYTLSIGIAVGLHCKSSLEDLLKKSDEALYLAKTAGRNRVWVYTEK